MLGLQDFVSGEVYSQGMEPIVVEPEVVAAAGITPDLFAAWAMERRSEGKTEQALRLLDASAAMVRAGF